MALRWRRKKREARQWISVHHANLALAGRAAVVLSVLVAVPLVLAAARAGLRSLRTSFSTAEAVTLRELPSLPVLPNRFGGVTLVEYLQPPAVQFSQMDDLLASPVLRDADFAREVHWWVDYWALYATRWFPGFLERMAARGGAVDSALVSRGFPGSLRYLPLIESGYDPGVTSRTGAAGLWQLMPSTARGLGLQVGALRDERRHEEKSTEAALAYLESLHSEFGSWFLALAAYNSGPTRVRGILRRHASSVPGSDSLFWALREHFPRETREFVPKLYGAMWVASRPEAYGYEVPGSG